MSRPPVEVRRALPSDLDELIELWGAAREELARQGRLPHGHLHGVNDGLRPRLRDTLESGLVPIMLARYEGVPAGYVVLRVAPLTPVFDGAALHVEHLFVRPDVRRRGVARALLAAAAATAERCGAEQVICNVAPSARETHRFFARLGFAPLVVRRVTTTATLRRRLGGPYRRPGLEDLLSRRRSQRARVQEEAAAAALAAGEVAARSVPAVVAVAVGASSAELPGAADRPMVEPVLLDAPGVEEHGLLREPPSSPAPADR